jgi:indolepyruvate ferredoxin oxidoreductase
VAYRLHPPVLRSLGLDRKISVGTWADPALRLLAKGRRLRGTPFDPFGYTEVRRAERRLVTDYRSLLEELLRGLTPHNHALAVEAAGLPARVRGYEHRKLAGIASYLAARGPLLREFEAAESGARP